MTMEARHCIALARPVVIGPCAGTGNFISSYGYSGAESCQSSQRGDRASNTCTVSTGTLRQACPCIPDEVCKGRPTQSDGVQRWGMVIPPRLCSVFAL